MSNSTDPVPSPAGGTSQAPGSAAPSGAMAVEADLGAAILGGLIAALAGAIAWAVITVTTKLQIGFMAVGVGFLVAWAVRTLGKGRTPVFGIIGGAFALTGCLLGNLLSACGFLAAANSEPVVSVAMSVLSNPSGAINLMRLSFHEMDVLFYAIAVYEGYKLSLRPGRV